MIEWTSKSNNYRALHSNQFGRTYYLLFAKETCHHQLNHCPAEAYIITATGYPKPNRVHYRMPVGLQEKLESHKKKLFWTLHLKPTALILRYGTTRTKLFWSADKILSSPKGRRPFWTLTEHVNNYFTYIYTYSDDASIITSSAESTSIHISAHYTLNPPQSKRYHFQSETRAQNSPYHQTYTQHSGSAGYPPQFLRNFLTFFR